VEAEVRLVPGQVETLIGLIATGALDPCLPELTNAIDRRQREMLRARSVRALGEFAVGDRVRVNGHIRPLYLRGATGTVTGWSGHRVMVHLDEAAGRFAGGEVRVPPLGLDRMPRAA
jgi:ribosomal protein L21E